MALVQLWALTHLTGVPIPFRELLRMKNQKADFIEVVRTMIEAKKAGLAVPLVEVERAALNGVDLRQLLAVMIEAKKRGVDITFQELIDQELSRCSLPFPHSAED